MNPLVVVRTQVDMLGRPVARGLWLWCPGCNKAHRPRAATEDGSRADNGPYWDWNGATDETFTIFPSLLCNANAEPDQVAAGHHRCHSLIRNGRWEFLADCTHALAGQTVPMVPVPDWLVRESS